MALSILVKKKMSCEGEVCTRNITSRLHLLPKDKWQKNDAYDVPHEIP